MKTINRAMTNICSDDLSGTRDFYIKLFDFKVGFDSDWFIHLVSKDNQVELGIITRKSELVPVGYKNDPNGFYMTFVVDNADEVYELAKVEKFEVLEAPTDTSYGQRRLLLKDPNGVLLDVSSPIENFQF